MDIHQISEQTGLPVRMIRYVVDQMIVPGLKLRHASDSIGNPRQFSEVDAFAIACGASLLTGGLKRDLVEAAMQTLWKFRWPPTGRGRKVTALQAAFALDIGPASLSIGDGKTFQITIGKSKSDWFRLGTLGKWREPAPPIVAVAVDLVRLRSELFGAKLDSFLGH